MSVAATVHAVDRAAWGDHVDLAWRVTVAVDRPTSWAPHGWLAFFVAGVEPCPLVVGDRVTVPVQVADGHVVLHRPTGDARVRMLGTADDPDAPLH